MTHSGGHAPGAFGYTGAPVAPTWTCWWTPQQGGLVAESQSVRDAWDQMRTRTRTTAAPPPAPQLLEVICGQCSGSKGWWVGDAYHKCGTCGGKGTVTK
ncbi:hypothetical protein LO762_10600 [Actinocorallia sp. API 0066]|uniref:hypothetical protein n=1 Tax=Actinocorallia sp. API 0066 TaxID=2896846 RepID=UPI001E428490|nr:hypothetical protein [Actinocorallia sp. API 0066]MCD0449636.1 hypothetical protein [Actinocorallia sp. API 0066]